MKTMDDVRAALLAAYRKQAASGPIEGKSSEGWCALHYPVVWDFLDEGAGFNEPSAIEIYSYALGPSRSHYINRGKVDRQVNYYTWESPDIFAKAVEVINGWVDQIGSDE